MKQLALVVAVLSANLCAQTSNDKCVLAGTVRNAVTGEGVKKAEVTIRSSNGSYATTVADAAGHYMIDNLEPGNYMVAAERTGFVNPGDSERRAGRSGITSVSLQAGDSRRDVDLRLIPQGVISGRVLDEDGDPLSPVYVQLLRSRYVHGRKQIMNLSGATTNDLGEFRISGLSPGKYFLVAIYRRPMQYATKLAGASHAESGYPPTYYPAALQLESATPVTVAAGAQMRGMDISLSRVQALRIRGRVVDGLNKPLPNASVRFVPRNSNLSMMTAATMRNSEGSFEFYAVEPGPYLLSSDYIEEGVHMTGRLPVEVGDTNIDGLVLPVGPSPEISGKIVIEGKTENALTNINVYLEPRTRFENAGSSAIAAENGSFVLKYVLPEQYDVNVAGLSGNLYVKAIKLGDVDVTDSGLDFTQGVSSSRMAVVLSNAGGRVEGIVQDENQKPYGGATVVLVPEASKRVVSRLYRTAVTDTNGHYVMTGIAPGDYKLFAWEQIEEGAYQDPDFLKAFESKGESVSMQENAAENKALTLIQSQ